MGLIFVGIGITILIFGYDSKMKYNANFEKTSCYFSKGIILNTTCQIARHGCWNNCKQSCWKVFYGLRSTNFSKISTYFYLNTYFGAKGAKDALDSNIGLYNNSCYYNIKDHTIILDYWILKEY